MSSLWQELMDDYNTYNQYVDVVSCFESYFENVFDDSESDFHRFPPTHYTIDGESFKPDFSGYVNNNYGILFELKRTVGGQDEGFEKTCDQLCRYLKSIDTEELDICFPDNNDVVFLVHHTDARSIASTIREKLEDRPISDDNLIILQYSTTEEDTIFKYKFNKVFRDSPDFSNEYFEDINPLNEAFGGPNDYAGVGIPTKYFWHYRSKCQIMNDKPYPVYLACVLWKDYFLNKLSKKQKISISKTNKHIPIEINVSDLKEEIEKKYPIRKAYLKSCLDFLVEGNLAEKVDNENYVVYFRKTKTDPTYTEQMKEEERQKFVELSKKFIAKYEKHKTGEREIEIPSKKEEKDVKEVSLDEFND